MTVCILTAWVTALWRRWRWRPWTKLPPWSPRQSRKSTDCSGINIVSNVLGTLLVRPQESDSSPSPNPLALVLSGEITMTTMPAFTMMDAPTEMAHSEQQFWRSSYWDAVTGRDRAMDGVFFYAVRTTGVYCRPSCPSRRPRPENVVFFRTRSGAERAGFRPCMRCKPERDIQTDANSEIVEKVCR